MLRVVIVSLLAISDDCASVAAQSSPVPSPPPTENTDTFPDWDDSAWDVWGCTETMLAIAERQGEANDCGLSRPPARLKHFLNGIWEIESVGNPEVRALTIYVDFSNGVLQRDDPNKPAPASANWWFAGEPRNRDGLSAFRLTVSADGAVTADEGAFGYCGCRRIHWQVRRTGDPDVLVGTWRYDGEEGKAVWRRRSDGPTIRRVEVRAARRDASGEPTNDRYAYGSRAGRVYRDAPVTCARGRPRNCDSIWVTLLGDAFAGAHTIWIDPASGFEPTRDSRWVCGDGELVGQWRRCGIGRSVPDSQVAGISVKLLMWDGMRSGRVDLWVDGRPVPLDVQIKGIPAADAPRLRYLDALDPQGRRITKISEGEPFVVKAIYDGPHPDPWIEVALPGSGNAADVIMLRRGRDPEVFESGWLAVMADLERPE